jgi:hypothetical protein
MEEHLLKLLSTLESLGNHYDELYDSEVREAMGEVIMQGFVRCIEEYEIPAQFGMFTPNAEKSVRDSIASYIDSANRTAEECGLNCFHDRLNAFQNSDVRVNRAVNVDYEELFGHTPPDWYDEGGNVIWDRVR